MTRARARAARFTAWRARSPWVYGITLTLFGAGLGGVLLMGRLVRGTPAALQALLAGGLMLAAALALFAGLEAKQARSQGRRLGRDVLILAAIMAGLEGILRAVTFRQVNILASKQDIYYFGAEPLESSGPHGDLPPGESVWLISYLRPYTVAVNRQGLRNVEDVDPRAFRILAIGDSFTFGPYVANEDTWPALLETELRNAYPRTPIQVLNAGIAGYGITQELGYLEDKGLALRPDLVILAFYPNDLNEVQPARAQLFQRPTRRSWDALAWLTRHSVLFHELRSIIVKRMFERARKRAVAIRDAAPPAALAEANEEGYRQQFNETVERLRQAGVPLVVVAFPEAGQVPPGRCPDAPQRFVERIASEAGVPFLDLLPVFSRHRLEELYLLRYEEGHPLSPGACFAEGERYVGNGHLARFGYQVCAGALSDWLASLKVIPRRHAGRDE